MSDKTQYGLVRLSDEDRKLLNSVLAALKGGAPAKGKQAAKAADDDAFGDESGDESGDEGDESGDEGDESGEDAFGDEAEEEVTLEQVRAALTDLANATDKANAIKVMKTASGKSKLTEVPKDKFKAVVDACATATKKATKKK
jgi:hypothetical protein